MNIHVEKEVKSFKDRQLLVRLLAYAKPYWSMILLCIILSFLIVVADLARPYLIKVAIDGHINGLHKPMLSADSGQAESLEVYGSVTEWNGKAYVRLEPKEAEAAAASMPPGTAQAQIVRVDGKDWLADGWLPGEREQAVMTEEGGKPVIRAAGSTRSAELMDPIALEAFRSQDYTGFLLLGAVFLVAVVGAALLSYLQGNLLQYTGQRIIFNIREQLFNHLSRMSMSYFDRNPVGRLVVRVTQDTESLNQLYSQVVVNLIKDVIVLIGIVIVMLQLSMELALLSFAVLPFLAVLTFWYRSVIRDAQRRTRMILSRLNSFLAENLSGIRITQLFIREERQGEQFDHHNTEHYQAGMRGTVINSIFQPAIGFLGNLAIALLLWYGGASVIEGGITFGVVYAFTHYVRQFFQPLMSLAEKYNQIQTAMVGAERIFDMLDEKPSIVDSKRPKRLPQEIRGEISFENVSFAYNGDDWVLKDVSFTIEPGQTIAFVGATGAGKSSIIQLINRFYDIQKGSIKLDGIDIRQLPLDDLRRYISIVQQDVFLFTGDIASNIRLNKEDITDEQVIEAARMVHMDDYIRSLPAGYQTLLGERGINLSLGQRQLLSFARAIAFRPQILILDEATSNIDTETELIVQDALHNISGGRTTLIVAHRLSTIQHADQIIVMHNGKVREIGNHDQLLAHRGYYHRLYKLQYKERKPMPKAR
ncbi:MULTISPECIES: ABC transporter ATP-binding protein [unclassified Paenibacillus]|uniref:ABC transporter ATP-binding protein n=1 Tax=unclassified Paenibacillus TaxID=185978 RepID=UPI001B6580CB|nr:MULTISPECIES: ABC transporter ATP-binding protein [unclassified Paenibacillus]MBP1154216.1 ATP-binding cassette subfamily B protein [Paenibacillus sp. PvP091]MBP1170399.1 ATP-binding cassette subfamily B protein [Paenibacillus sp. PvR098]MBP2441427.1 ATP-binding cassette subfamily B protein [Paenibacillus sp. PvP052]